jgi:hypothetical protein
MVAIAAMITAVITGLRLAALRKIAAIAKLHVLAQHRAAQAKAGVVWRSIMV